jgi:DNA-binding transcriptional regulator YdaS (Cro superfamily)
MSKKVLHQVIDFFGSQKATAKELRCTQQAISLWFKFGVPIKRAIQIEKKTGGKFTRDQLRPDVFFSRAA